MYLKVLNDNGKVCSNILVYDSIFNKKYNDKLIHQIIVSYKANTRLGNRKQKNRSEVNHSTKKPWKQKGTGRARAGMSSSPLWRGGGRAFPNFPYENFHHKINKKMYRLSISMILSKLIFENRLFIIENFFLNTYKTKILVKKIKNMNLDSVLIIIENIKKNLILASRNLHNISIIKTQQINPISLIYFKKILLSKESLIKIQNWLLI
ncbi:50S ribosomal protein L4 [Candidatus Zinderia endosymbiont of Aphrophora alni]|uniref:50S ribosomal protein L4 n=1 Tax=Candidatus Zinderia endosymbiont of Aphrophora alni TaxID=3077951 RepID=UPI0030D0BCA0